MVKILLTVLVFSTLSCCSAFAQNDNSEFIQFVITNMDSREKSLEIDHYVRSQPGVEISRADLNSKKYLCIYNPNAGVTPEKILSWMDYLHVEYKCVRTGVKGVNQIIDQKFDCDKE